ncbi:MAG: hypothetical protein ACLQUY_25870 [Ktedonobacterales bacterium]
MRPVRQTASASSLKASRSVPHDRSHHLSWEANLWGRHIRCHELDQHIYLDERFLDLTPIEFGLFWLLLQQTLWAQVPANSAGGPAESEATGASHHSQDEPSTVLDRYLRQVGIVPIGRLLQAITSDLRSVIANRPAGDDRHARGMAGRASLTSHLDRLRQKLRCHGLDVGTVLLFGRSAQGYMLFPLVDDTDGDR